jgi:oligoribonuclease (3'-5' exoribonuclease)
MKITSETLTTENKELLPQVIQRIFSVCKTDLNFPLENKSKVINGKVASLKQRTMKQMEVARRAKETRENLIERIEDLEERNQETKNELLDYLGSE